MAILSKLFVIALFLAPSQAAGVVQSHIHKLQRRPEYVMTNFEF